MEKPYFPGLAVEKTPHRLESGLLFDEFLDDKREDGGKGISLFLEFKEIVSEPGAFQAFFHDPPFMGGVQLLFAFGYVGALLGSYVIYRPAAFPLHENLRRRKPNSSSLLRT